jgi:hypothetical protein
MSASQTKTRWIWQNVGDVVLILMIFAAWLIMFSDIFTGRRPADPLSVTTLFVCAMSLFRIVTRTIEGWKTNRDA